MTTIIRKAATVLVSAAMLTSISSYADNNCKISNLGEGHSILVPQTKAKYLLIPVQESNGESRVAVFNDNEARQSLNIRLAKDKIDYYVPFEYQEGDKFYIHEPFNRDAAALHTSDDESLWKSAVKMSDNFEIDTAEKYRPAFHFTPRQGWMNDPNGMFYKDGVYHLYYQHNQYAAVWGNMSWGHATSTDLVHWNHHPVAIDGDTALGAIFSGSCIIDKDNTAGFGKDAIIAFYTAAAERQMQSMAYSTDGGMTFTKYEGNPIVTSGKTDFRDPKVIWHEPTKKWIMILAGGQEMEFWSSSNLKDWTYESSFGEGQGCHGGVWECPDLMLMPVEGTTESKWVLICNINPGGPAGGSATQYFVGDFDGKKFTNATPEKTKWMDYGKDHYAAVSWSNAPEGRHIGIAWMSNWQYANVTPTKMFRSSNSLPREWSLYEYDGDYYVKSAPVKEFDKCLVKTASKSKISIGKKPSAINIPGEKEGIYAIDCRIEKPASGKVMMSLVNASGERVDMYYDGTTFNVDRSKSGLTGFSADFAKTSSAPVNSDSDYVDLRIVVDKASVEVFGDGGKFVLTNLVYPAKPYGKIEFSTDGKKTKVTDLKIYKINL